MSSNNWLSTNNIFTKQSEKSLQDEYLSSIVSNNINNFSMILSCFKACVQPDNNFRIDEDCGQSCRNKMADFQDTTTIGIHSKTQKDGVYFK